MYSGLKRGSTSRRVSTQWYGKLWPQEVGAGVKDSRDRGAEGWTGLGTLWHVPGLCLAALCPAPGAWAPSPECPQVFPAAAQPIPLEPCSSWGCWATAGAQDGPAQSSYRDTLELQAAMAPQRRQTGAPGWDGSAKAFLGKGRHTES